MGRWRCEVLAMKGRENRYEGRKDHRGRVRGGCETRGGGLSSGGECKEEGGRLFREDSGSSVQESGRMSGGRTQDSGTQRERGTPLYGGGVWAAPAIVVSRRDQGVGRPCCFRECVLNLGVVR